MHNQPEQLRNWIEGTPGISISEADWIDSESVNHSPERKEIFRAAIRHSVPWLDSVPEDKQESVNKLLTTLLELEVKHALGENGESGLETASLSDFSIDERAHFSEVWQSCFWPNRDLAGMAAYSLGLMRHGRMIYHILPSADWREANSAGVYAPLSLAADRFIHCSNIDQVTRSANAYFKGQKDLLVISIAAEWVKAEIRDEDLLGVGMDFPHIYGPLNLDAVIDVFPLNQDDQGDFQLPRGLDRFENEQR